MQYRKKVNAMLYQFRGYLKRLR